MNEEMIFTHLIIDATKHLLSLEAVSVNNAKKINNDINLFLFQQRCNNYNTKDKDCIIEQKINHSCDRLHTCNTCKKLDHFMFKCIQNMSFLLKSIGN